jgi:hypothetical protein
LRYAVLVAVWLVVAVGAGAAGLPARLHPPFPQVVLLALTALLLGAGWGWPGFRAWLVGLPWRTVVAIHLSRFVGVYFLWLSGRGELPREFAVPAGVGDVAVALLATALLSAPVPVERRPSLLAAWNLLGLADILFVVARAAALGLARPDAMQPLLRLPLSLLPTFLVPIIIASHVLLLSQTRIARWNAA